MSYLAEQNLIGSLLIDSKSIDEVYATLTAEMFESEILGRIYLEFQRGYDNHYEVNQVVLLQKLQGDHFPGDLVLKEIKESVLIAGTSAHIKSYAQVIADDHKARCFQKILSSTVPSPNGIEGQIGKLITDLESLLSGKMTTAKTVKQIVEENRDKYFADVEAERMYLGFPKLDDLLGGLEGGDMIVIGARPAVGKSALVSQITMYMAKRGKRIGFYNLEMQNKQLYERFVSSSSGISMNRLRRAKQFLGSEKEQFDKANEMLLKLDNIFISTGSKAVSEIRAESRHMGYDLIIIDYLQLLKADKLYRGNRTAEVGAISKAIKALAMELNIPIIALSQLNRVSEAKETREPTMAELREAGDIEQDASVIILMWNMSQENPSKKGCKVEKQRQGQTGKIVLNFNGDKMQFEEAKETVKEAQDWATAEDDSCPFT